MIAGLEALNRPCEVTLYSDSKYVVDAFNQHWIDGWLKKGWKRGKNEPVKNVDLWKRLLQAKEAHQVTFIWVKGHDGHPQNERCDTLATTAADGNDLIIDEGIVKYDIIAFTQQVRQVIAAADAERQQVRKSGLHRAGCRITSGGGDSKASATEMYRVCNEPCAMESKEAL